MSVFGVSSSYGVNSPFIPEEFNVTLDTPKMWFTPSLSSCTNLFKITIPFCVADI